METDQSRHENDETKILTGIGPTFGYPRCKLPSLHVPLMNKVKNTVVYVVTSSACVPWVLQAYHKMVGKQHPMYKFAFWLGELK